MSFRTEVIQKVGFNENLGCYALYEDIEAGLGVLAGGGIVLWQLWTRGFTITRPQKAEPEAGRWG